MVAWAATLLLMAWVFRDRIFPSGGDAAVPPVQIQADGRSAGMHAPPALTRLVGRWRRLDGGYTLDIKAIADDGKIDATYLNPRPIHVSKAEAITKGGHVIVVVTLQDQGYPGNMYTLTYDPQADRLEGVYHHRGLGRQFEVEFSRLRSAQNAQE